MRVVEADQCPRVENRVPSERGVYRVQSPAGSIAGGTRGDGQRVKRFLWVNRRARCALALGLWAWLARVQARSTELVVGVIGVQAFGEEDGGSLARAGHALFSLCRMQTPRL